MVEKQVGYAYPSSDTAGRLGFGKAGCHFCRILHDGRGWSIRDKGFSTEQAALSYADNQPEPYCFFSVRPDGAKPWLSVARNDYDIGNAYRAARGLSPL